MLIDYDPAHAFMPYPKVAVPHAASGPLQGLTFAVKDLFDVKGYPTSAGNPHMLALSGIKEHTAPTVQKLLAAGATFLGKTYTDELAFSMSGINAHFGAPRNGAAPMRITGGSSSGSAAAVSNNLVDFAIGTDTGGSIRCPASHCGLIGLRPSHGRISLDKAIYLAPSFDTCGFLARTIDVFDKVGQVLLAADSAPYPARVRLLYPTDGWALLAAEVQQALWPALVKIEAHLGKKQEVIMAPYGFDENFSAFRYIQGREAWLSDGALIEQHGFVLGPGVHERFMWSKTLTDDHVEASWQHRRKVTRTLTDLLGDDGILVLPSQPDIAPLLTTPESEIELFRQKASKLLCLAGLSECPQISLPLATLSGCPIGISLLAPKGRDRYLIELAKQILAE